MKSLGLRIKESLRSLVAWRKSESDNDYDLDDNIENNLDKSGSEALEQAGEVNPILDDAKAKTGLAPEDRVRGWSAFVYFVSFICIRKNIPAISTAQVLNLAQVSANALSSLLFAKTAEAAFNEEKSALILGEQLSLEFLLVLLTASYSFGSLAKTQA